LFPFPQGPSSEESDSDSDYSFHIPSVFRFESLHDLQRLSDSPEIKPNDHIPAGELRMLVKNYVQGIVRQSADVLGVDIKFQERTPREQIPRITDVKRIRKLLKFLINVQNIVVNWRLLVNVEYIVLNVEILC
jgi:hypothetical protein